MFRRLCGGIDYPSLLREFTTRRVNYRPEEVGGGDWNFDVRRQLLATEEPGAPEPGGAWELARALIRDYEFCVPGLLRAVYDRRCPLLGRTMVLEGRFYGLHLYMGVRVTEVVDEVRHGGDRAWGWAYETLDGHVERGKITYEVVKHGADGRVEFVVTACSQRAPTLGPVMRLGWRVFGRGTQLRFYRRCTRRLRDLVRRGLANASRLPEGPDARVGDLVRAPSGVAPHVLEHLALRYQDPAGDGRRRGRPR